MAVAIFCENLCAIWEMGIYINQSLFSTKMLMVALTILFLEVAGIMLCKAHKENKRAKSECSFTLFCFFKYR